MVSTRLAPAITQRLDELAQARGCSRAAVVRSMVQDALARLGDGAATPEGPDAPGAAPDVTTEVAL